MSRSSRSPAARRANCWPKSCRRSSAPSPGRNRCAGARPRRGPTRCAGCGRCTRSCARSAARTRRRRRRLRGRRHRGRQRHLRPSLHGAAGDQGRAASRITSRRSPRPRSCSTPTGARHHPADAHSLALAQGLELVEDEGLLDEVAGLVEWPVVLMGEFDADFLDIPPEVDPRHHPRQPEMFRAARCTRASSPTSSSSSPTSSPATAARRSRRAMARRARAAFRRAPFLADRSRAPARLQGQGGQAARPAAGKAEGARHRVPREARHAGRARRAHRGAGARARAAASAPIPISPSAPRGSPRPISSPRWSASSPSCRA